MLGRRRYGWLHPVASAEVYFGFGPLFSDADAGDAQLSVVVIHCQLQDWMAVTEEEQYRNGRCQLSHATRRRMSNERHRVP